MPIGAERNHLDKWLIVLIIAETLIRQQHAATQNRVSIWSIGLIVEGTLMEQKCSEKRIHVDKCWIVPLIIAGRVGRMSVEMEQSDTQVAVGVHDVVSQTLKKKAHQVRSNHGRITELRGIRHKLRNGTSHGRITDKIDQTQKPQV